MAGARMTFSFKDRGLRAEVMRLASLDKDFEPFLKSIGEEFVGAGGIINRRFAEERGPDGEEWQPLSAKWIKRRLKKYPGSPLTILRMRGHLAGAIVYQVAGGKLTIGTDSSVERYAAAHQLGYDGGEGKPRIPARPYLGFADENMDMIEEEALDYFLPDG